uniref:DUF3456 domain-containing protein n=1 Tax=Anser cygnoides TaxID=8845 RepID=A0A8B9EKS0_ANSCY
MGQEGMGWDGRDGTGGNRTGGERWDRREWDGREGMGRNGMGDPGQERVGTAQQRLGPAQRPAWLLLPLRGPDQGQPGVPRGPLAPAPCTAAVLHGPHRSLPATGLTGPGLGRCCRCWAVDVRVPAACRALVDELEWEIAQVDPRKTIQMGSFRINPDGSQSVVEVPYARSEAHLTELLERVCEKMKEYGEKVDPSTHRKSYVRIISHDGTKMDLSGVKIDGDVASSLKFACESIAEEYEDELIEFLSHEADNVKDRLCSKRTDLCDHALHIPHDEL